MRPLSSLCMALAFFGLAAFVVAPVVAQQAGAAPRMIAPGKSLAGITLGSPVRLVITRFGTPSDVKDTDRDVIYLYNKFGINIYAHDDLVTAVSTSNSLLRISSALGPGFGVANATAEFGRGYRQGSVEGFTGLVYDDSGIAFGVDGNAIAVVLVFKPGTAESISGLQKGIAVVPHYAAGYPVVGNQIPYVAGTNYMSLPGYLRWVVFQASASWITMAEASRVIKEQRAQASSSQE